MRIVQVNAFHYPYRGGIEHRVHHIAKRLAEKHEVIILTGLLPNTSSTEEMDGYTVRRLPSKQANIYNPPYIKTPGLLNALQKLQPDVVDFHYRWAPTYNKAARHYPGKKVFTYHNTYGEGVGLTKIPSIINDFFWSKRLKQFQKIVCVSEFVRQDLIAREFSPEQLVTVPNGIDMPPEMTISDDNFILFVGRLVGTKGLPYLIRAMKNVDCKLIICGGGPDKDKLQRLTGKLALKNKVQFPGRVSEQEKHKLFSSCSLFVLPSIYESFGIAAAEAMSYGKPVIASNVGGLPEVVNGGGLLANAKDSGDLAKQINSLLKNPEKRKLLGIKAKELASGYTWDSSAEQMDKVYNDIYTV